jgi:hypothetical protein
VTHLNAGHRRLLYFTAGYSSYLCRVDLSLIHSKHYDHSIFSINNNSFLILLFSAFLSQQCTMLGESFNTVVVL